MTNKHARNAGLLLLTSGLMASGGSLLWWAGCLWDDAVVPLCRHDAGAWVVWFVIAGATWLWMAGVVQERLRRRLRRGMYDYRRVGLSVGPTLVEQISHFVIEGEWPHRRRTVALHDRRGWWVETPVDGGTRVWVGRQAMWQWLVDVAALHRGMMEGSAIGQRRWEPLVGRAQWWGRCWLLEQVGGIEYATADPRSRRLVRTDISRLMEDLEGVLGITEEG